MVDGRTGRALRPDIQGLRAIAVLAVIADHLVAFPRGGFIGVDVFFVISGFLITDLLLREHDRTGTISFTGFYARRVRRIIPAAVLVLVTTVATSYLLLGGARFTQALSDSIAALLFSANWHFARQGTDYFQEGLPPSPVEHYWSLAVEEQYYLVWPWVMLAVLAFAVRRLGWDRRGARLAAGLAIAAITGASLAWGLHETVAAPTVAYFSTFSRAWELGVGALVAILGGAARTGRAPAGPEARTETTEERAEAAEARTEAAEGRAEAAEARTEAAEGRAEARPWVRTALAWAGVAGIVASLFVVPEAPGFPVPWALLPVLATALVIAAGRDGRPRLWPLTNPVSRYVGDISYSLYLWHFPVIVLLAAILPTEGIRFPVIALVLVAALSVATYHGVEDPVRRLAWSTERPRAARWWLRPGLAGVALAACVTVAATPFGGTAASSVADADDLRRCLGAAAMDPARACEVAVADFVLPAPADLSRDTGGAFDCWIAEGAPLRTCAYGDPAGRVSVALLGDSHAAMLLPALRPHLAAYGWRLDSYVGWGCQWMMTGTGSTCDATMADIQDRLVNGPRYDIAIVTAARQKTARDKEWVARMYAQAWQPVAARGTKIVVVADNPGVPESTLRCVGRVGLSARDNACATPAAVAFAEVDALIPASTMVEGAALVDLGDFFCRDGSCPAVIGNVITYRDTAGHITGTYSRTLGPYLARAIAEAATD